MDGESEHDATVAAAALQEQQQGLPESAGEAGELVRVPRDPRQIAEEREREGDVDAPPEAPALELEFSSMAAAQSAQLMFQAAGRGDVGALDAEVAMARRIHEDEPSWQQAREAAVHMLLQTQRRQEEEEEEEEEGQDGARANRFDFGGMADAAAVPAAAGADPAADPLPLQAASAPPPPVSGTAAVAAPPPMVGLIPKGTVAVGVSLEDQVALATEYLRSGRQHSANDRWEEAIADFGAGRWQLKAYFLEPEPEPEPAAEPAVGDDGGSEQQPPAPAPAVAAAAGALSDGELDRRAALTEELWIALHIGLAAVYMRTGAYEGGCYCTEEVLCCCAAGDINDEESESESGAGGHLEALFLRGQMRCEMGDWSGAAADLAHAHRLTTRLVAAAEGGDAAGGGGTAKKVVVAGAERWRSRDAQQQLAMQLDAKTRECEHKLMMQLQH